MELLRLHFPGVHRALREALDSLSTFASYFLEDIVPYAEERGRDEGRGEELGETTAEGSQQAEKSKEALEEEVISSKDLEDTFSSRGSESREAWEKGKEKNSKEIQESEAEGTWEVGKDVEVCPNEEMTRVCRTWDSNKNSKEAKGEIRGNYKVEVQGARCMMAVEPKQGQKTDAGEVRECKKEGILAEGYLETEGFASEEKGGKEQKAQGKKNQEPSKKEVNVGKAENYWKLREETEAVGEQKEEAKEIKPGDLEERALIAFRVESEDGIIWEKEKEDRQIETEGNVRDRQEAREDEKAQKMKKGEPGYGQKIEIETRSRETKKAPDGALGGGFGKDGKVETPEKQELEKHEVKGTWEAERIEIRWAKKEMEKEVAWEVQGIRPVDIDIKKLQGVQEPGEKTEREDSVKSEVWITSVMEKAEAREAVKSKTAGTSPKTEAEEAWKAEDIEISTEWNTEVIQGGWDTEEAAGKDLEKKKDKERETEENLFPEQVPIQKTGREEEVADFWVLEKKETVKVLESEMEGEGSWGLKGEAEESCENQSEQNRGQDIQETTVWEGTLDNVSRRKEIESVEAKEVMGGWEVEPGRPQDIEETERIEDLDETWVTRPEKEVEGAKLMREAEVGKSQELETKDLVSYGTEEVREDQNPEEIGGNWNVEAGTGRAQETDKEPREIQDLKEEEVKGREEEPFRIPERETLGGCKMETYSAQNIKNTESGNVQEVKKQDLVVVEGWKIMEGEVESGQVTEIEDKGGCEGEEEVFILQSREDEGNWETKRSQQFKQQEVPKAEVKSVWGTKETGTTEPEVEEKEVRGVWEKELEGGQEAQVDKGHTMEESEARKLQEREAMEAKEYWEAEREVIRSQEMKEIEGSQEREDKSSRMLDREAEEVWKGNAGSPWNTEIVNEKVGLNLKEAEARRSQETEQKVKRDCKEIKRDWDSEEAISQERTETRDSPGSNLLKVGVSEALEEENKGFWEAEGTEECQATEGMTERDQAVEESEAGRSWEREEKEYEGDQETGLADAEESWIVEKVETGINCDKEKSVFCQGAEIQMVMTNKEVELVREKEIKEGQIKSEEKPEEGKGNRETGEGVDGDQGVNSESTWPLEEETQYEEDTQAEAKVGGSHTVEGESSMDNQYMDKVEANGGRRLEAEKIEGSDNIEEAGGQADGKREELEPAGYSDTKKAAGWGDEDKDLEAFGVWGSSEKTGTVWELEKAEPGQGRGTEEASDTGSEALEASDNRETEASAPTNSIVLRLSPVPNPADEAQSSWSEAPIPGPCLDLSIPRSRVLLSRSASQRRSRPSFRRAPAPKKDDSDNDESLGFLPNEGSPASKLRLLQSEETAVPSPPKPEGTPVTARKRPPGHGFGLAHPSMMQELQARLGRPKPQ
ncbi:apolipoprotein B receptor [Trichosurus vulpecula]|uniref:apolipoprotein B receptor n=1 Tax=Trichosurus vulpecula TaxID=9337 RepID=UPI00186B2D9D|nr:apolipoprotein B receptor [Trichosurus vulpecula]